MRSYFASFILLALVQSAIAQQSNTLVGNWVGTMQGLSGNQLDVELTLGEKSGVFIMRPPRGNAGRSNQCFGKDFPVTVSSQSPSEAAVEIKGASVLPGCIDQSVTFKTADGKSMEGVLPDGRQIRLGRK